MNAQAEPVEEGQQDSVVGQVLASIRRHMSGEQESTGQTPRVLPPGPNPEPVPEPEAAPEPESACQVEPTFLPELANDSESASGQPIEAGPAFAPELEVEMNTVVDLAPKSNMAEPEADDDLEPADPPVAGRDSDEAIVSQPAVQASADVLADLSKAIFDQREPASGDRGITMEALLRGMLRPLIKDWLDRSGMLQPLVQESVESSGMLQPLLKESLEDSGMLRALLKEWLDTNLPSLVERLVKKEIDRVVNRAESLEE